VARRRTFFHVRGLRCSSLSPVGVFAVHTPAGNFAKINLLSHGNNLGIQWVTCRVGG
jgi:hypothetical protein